MSFLPPNNQSIFAITMTSLHLYQPPKINLKVNLPSAWDELLDDELFFISKTLLQQNENNANETRGMILYYLIKERAKKEGKLPGNWISLVNPEDFVRDIYPLADFIFNKNDRTSCPEIHGTKVDFENITCGEFEDSEMASAKFSQSNDPRHLAEIAAILFRPKKLISRKRKPYLQFNSRTDSYLTYKSENKVADFLKLNPDELYAILIWYSGSRNQLPFIFPDLYAGGKSGEPDPMVFTNTIHAGAGPKNGSRNQIRCMKLYEFLYDCNQEAKKAAEMEAEYEKMSKQ